MIHWLNVFCSIKKMTNIFVCHILGMCSINFSQTLLANQNTGTNQEVSTFALSEPMNGLAVVRNHWQFHLRLYSILLLLTVLFQSLPLNISIFFRHLLHALRVTSLLQTSLGQLISTQASCKYLCNVLKVQLRRCKDFEIPAHHAFNTKK